MKKVEVPQKPEVLEAGKHGVTVDPKTKEITVTLPKSTIKPVNGRIFAIAINPGLQKTKSGILIPTQFEAATAKGGRKRELLHYFAVDVADDVSIEIDGRKLSRGDEIFPFIPQEAEEWSFPTVFDFGVNQHFLVFHESELAGVNKVKNLIEENNK